MADRRFHDENSMIDVVQIDGLVVMKLIKQCHEEDVATQSFAQGALLGMIVDKRLEITHSFPFPSYGTEETAADDDFQLAMMKRLRMVNVDHLHVGWYQSTQFGNFLSSQLLESHFAYQTSIDEAVCLVFDTMKTNKGFLSLKAFRLTPEAFSLYKSGDFSSDSIHNQNVSYETLFREIPIVIKNSHLVNELLLEISESIPVDTDSRFLDLGMANVLEDRLKILMDTVDELNQESVKFNKYQNLALKMCQDKTRWIQRRQQDNHSRAAHGEAPLPDEDINKVFKPLPPLNRQNSLILSGQIHSGCEEIAQFCSQSLAKLFVTQALQSAKDNTSGC